MKGKHFLEEVKKHNGCINSFEDVLKHIERLQKCSRCGKDYYDKYCPDCIKKLSTMR